MLALPRTQSEAISFLQSHNIFPPKLVCEGGHDVLLGTNSARPRWRCHPCGKERSMRSGTWLEGTKLPLRTIIAFFYGWSQEYTSLAWCEKELKMSGSTAKAWNASMRDLCLADLLRRPKRKIGGPGMVVEIDESVFSKRKNHAGRVLPQQWVFGGICRETKDCFILKVPNRSAPTPDPPPSYRRQH